MLQFSIRDNKAESFNRPFFSQTRFTAMREVAVGLKQDETMASFASDFAIFETGEWSPITGLTTPYEGPKHVINCDQLLDKEF